MASMASTASTASTASVANVANVASVASIESIVITMSIGAEGAHVKLLHPRQGCHVAQQRRNRPQPRLPHVCRGSGAWGSRPTPQVSTTLLAPAPFRVQGEARELCLSLSVYYRPLESTTAPLALLPGVEREVCVCPQLHQPDQVRQPNDRLGGALYPIGMHLGRWKGDGGGKMVEGRW